MPAQESNQKGWRSRGWTPLQYPKSALQVDNLLYFPLHKDTLLAALREMLILEEQLDPVSLLWREDPGRSRKRQKTLQGAPDATGTTRKTRQQTTERAASAEEYAEDLISQISLTVRRPRKVSEADQDGSSSPSDEGTSRNSSVEISQVLDVDRHVLKITPTEPLVHVSIANEALLRETALLLTTRLVASRTSASLRLFLGYKTPAVPRERLISLLSSALFDTSHALFAWQQTSLEFPRWKQAQIQQHLFQDNPRALNKFGGVGPSSLLIHALSIGQFQSWADLAVTPRGKRLMAHHSTLALQLHAGKRRRGQRLRQPQWTPTTGNNKRLSPLYPKDGRDEDNANSDDQSLSLQSTTSSIKAAHTTLSTPNRLLSHMPGTRSIYLTKPPGHSSWGVGLIPQGSACVVGKISTQHEVLQPGDLILCATNGEGQEATSALIGGYSRDWYASMIDLFKNSQELQLVVQRL